MNCKPYILVRCRSIRIKQIVPDSVQVGCGEKGRSLRHLEAELAPSGSHAGSLIQLESGSSPQHKWPATKNIQLESWKAKNIKKHSFSLASLALELFNFPNA